MQLHTLIYDALLQVGGPPFGHCCGLGCEIPVVQFLDTVIDEDTRNFDFCLHLSELEARVLEAADGLAEGGALFAVFQGDL